ncbi:serine/threonine-protein kinase STY13-like [Solanum verrucosum]|uniref:serine/threonine-protein kinase STY13-like n=1 Tax=Solanum verrucosum TaxID=315347 RepID=UPI0020D1E2F3|nr:serine/threonine-protein kinase STY13-like [Solanum verrucosum]
MAKSRIIAKIDLRRMDEQLERHLDRVFSNNNGCTEETNKLELIMTKKQEWELDPTKLKVNTIIAKGTYGSVYKGVYDGKQVAVKILDLSNEKRRNIVTKAFTQEVSIWYNLHHPNIAKLIGGSKTLPPESTRWMKKWTRHPSLAKQTILEYGIVVEYVPGGTLRSHLLKNHIKKLPLIYVIQLALDVARGLSYLHSKKIVHRDVKSSNLVVDKEGRVKIIDFGVSRIEASCPINMTAQTGTIGYMAPEVLVGLPYDHKCDVYSFGICLWEIYCCSIPYIGQICPSHEISPNVYKSLRPEIPNTCPSAVANIMKQCWNENPKKRPEMKEVVLMLEAIDTTQDAQKGCFCFI